MAPRATLCDEPSEAEQEKAREIAGQLAELGFKLHGGDFARLVTASAILYRGIALATGLSLEDAITLLRNIEIETN